LARLNISIRVFQDGQGGYIALCHDFDNWGKPTISGELPQLIDDIHEWMTSIVKE
jgi:hypothetical protein